MDIFAGQSSEMRDGWQLCMLTVVKRDRSKSAVMVFARDAVEGDWK